MKSRWLLGLVSCVLVAGLPAPSGASAIGNPASILPRDMGTVGAELSYGRRQVNLSNGLASTPRRRQALGRLAYAVTDRISVHLTAGWETLTEKRESLTASDFGGAYGGGVKATVWEKREALKVGVGLQALYSRSSTESRSLNLLESEVFAGVSSLKPYLTKKFFPFGGVVASFLHASVGPPFFDRMFVTDLDQTIPVGIFLGGDYKPFSGFTVTGEVRVLHEAVPSLSLSINQTF